MDKRNILKKEDMLDKNDKLGPKGKKAKVQSMIS